MSADAAQPSGRSIDQQDLVRKANRQDLRFAILGFLVLMLAMATLLALVLDFMLDGVPRIRTFRRAGRNRRESCRHG
jgi:hypothetical protein